MDFLTSIFSALWSAGPVGMFAAIELVLLVGLGYSLWYLWKKRGSKPTQPKQQADEIKKLQSGHIDAISLLHQEYQSKIDALNEKRIADIKDLTADYNSLATEMVETISKLTFQLEVRGGGK